MKPAANGAGERCRPLALLITAVVAIACAQPLAAAELELQRVVDGVYAIVGELGNRTPKNLGNNATFGLVVTDAGAVLIDSGATYGGAAKIDALIKTTTAQPVVAVINTGGQDHRWLGNDYFRQRGARIIASNAAVADQRARAQDQLIALGNLVGADAVAATDPAYADTGFDERFEFSVGNTRFELRHVTPAHTPGDSFVWLPRQQVMFSGDIVYVERMPGVGPQSSSKGWLEAFATMAAYQPRHLVPGHGGATDLARARRDTYDYLAFLRAAVAAFMDAGNDLSQIGNIDQSRFNYLRNHETLAGRNAQRVFTELEWE